MGFAYNKDRADLSYTHVKGIAHHSPVKLLLSHQESRCICYYEVTSDKHKIPMCFVGGYQRSWEPIGLATQTLLFQIPYTGFPSIYAVVI